MKKIIGCLYDQMTAFGRDLKSFEALLNSDCDLNQKAILRELVKLIQKYPSNPRIIYLMIKFLGRCDDRHLKCQYTYHDIESLLWKSCKLFDKDIDLNLQKWNRIYWTNQEKAEVYLNQFQKKIATVMEERD